MTFLLVSTYFTDMTSSSNFNGPSITASQAVAEFLTAYHELNADFIDELMESPTPLEFMRSVASNRPFVVRKGISHWAALHKWDANYLKRKMGNTPVEVAMTPFGNADSVVRSPSDGRSYLAMPYTTHEAFNDFLDHVVAREMHQQPGNVRYAQTRR